MNVVFNKEGFNYIFKFISNYKNLMEILNDYSVNVEDSLMIKIFNSYNSENENNQPLIITDDYKEMIQKEIVTEKSVIIFHKDPSGINNIPKNVTKEMFFAKMLYKYNYNNNYELFNLAIGDNKAAIIDNDGSISLWCANKIKNWETSNGVFFSDDDYKYATSYSQTNYNSYYGSEYYDDERCSDYCTKCKAYSSSIIYFNNKPYCSACYKEVVNKTK